MTRSRESEEAPATNESKESQEQKGFVRYIGTAHVRSISQEDLHAVGLVDLVWNRANQWTIPRADIPDEVYERAVQSDVELILVNSRGDRF
jgi:hypothetical protein